MGCSLARELVLPWTGNFAGMKGEKQTGTLGKDEQQQPAAAAAAAASSQQNVFCKQHLTLRRWWWRWARRARARGPSLLMARRGAGRPAHRTVTPSLPYLTFLPCLAPVIRVSLLPSHGEAGAAGGEAGRQKRGGRQPTKSE